MTDFGEIYDVTDLVAFATRDRYIEPSRARMSSRTRRRAGHNWHDPRGVNALQLWSL